MAGAGDSSATDDIKVPSKGVDLTHALDLNGSAPYHGGSVGNPATQNQDIALQPADVPNINSSPDATTKQNLSNQSFDLWKASAAVPGTPEGQIFRSESAATTLQAEDGSAILSFNSDWLSESEPTLAAAKLRPEGKPTTQPGRPLDLSPPLPLKIPIPVRDPRKGQTDTPGTQKPQGGVPMPPRRPPKVGTDVPKNPGTDTPANDSPTSERRPSVEASFLPARVPTKPGQRTVIVVDDYRNSDMIVNAGKGFSHGELSARMAEENGLNTVRMQIGRVENGHYDLPNSLAKLNKSIDDGTVKVQKGDIVNLSFDMAKTFEDASRMLGITITPENLRAKRGQMLDIMRTKSVDRKTPKEDRELMNTILAVDENVRELQARGLMVVVAGGNRGKNSFNMGFLTADKHFSATGTDGKIAPYSADNSLTTPGLGEVNVYSQPLNPFDSTPFSKQKGAYRVGGTNIHLPADEFAGNHNFATRDPEVTRLLLFHKATTSGGLTGFNRNYETPPVISRFEGSAFTPIDARTAGMPIQPAYLAKFEPTSWTLGTNVLSVKGTSFVNIFKLRELKP